jgi:hypothetical protein
MIAGPSKAGEKLRALVEAIAWIPYGRPRAKCTIKEMTPMARRI